MTEVRAVEGEVAEVAEGIVARTSLIKWNGLRTGGIERTVSRELAEFRPFGGEGIPPKVEFGVAFW